MALFDQLGKKLAQTGQSAVKKTKDMAEVAKINSMISDEEKSINNNYYQIVINAMKIHCAFQRFMNVLSHTYIPVS